jgi:hypothetical protein
MPAPEFDPLHAAKQKLTLRDVWDMAPFPATPPERDGIVRVNPFREDLHPNFAVSEGGRVFKDFAREEVRGGVWEFVALCNPGWGKAEIADCLKRRAGMESPAPGKRAARSRAPRLQEPRARPVLWQPWPNSVRDRWEEGLAFLRSSEDRRAKIAAKRGWPVEVVDNLVESGAIAYPLLPWSNDRRGTAFIVQAPKLGALDSVSLVNVGYHQRWWKDARDGSPAEKAWIFVPNEKPESDREKWPLKFPSMKCPAAPFALGDVAGAQLVVFLEGQWDSITFFHAAGWFTDSFPGRVAVFGIRGNQGAQPFFDLYGKVWPWRPAAWVIRDADNAGKQWEPQHAWMRGESFCERLQTLCSRVIVSKLRDGLGLGKDFNDYWRAKRPGPTDIAAMMDALNLSSAIAEKGRT